MIRAPLPENEPARLESLRLCGILDTPPEPAFDELAQLAAQLCQTPLALLSLVDSDRQWVKSAVGTCITQTPRDSSFCAHAILADEPLVIPDTTADFRTRDNARVRGDPFIRFYAGAPLLTPDGFALGTLCVMDVRPRSISPEQIAGLQTLAQQVVLLLEQRKSRRLEAEQRRAIDAARYRISRTVAAIFLTGLTLTAMMTHRSREAIRAQSSQQFDRLTERVSHEVIRRANQVVYGLRGARGVFAACEHVNRDQFARYVASRDLPKEFPGAIGFGFIERVSPSNVETFVSGERADGAPDFAIQSHVAAHNPSADLYVVKYFNPIEPGANLIGFDVGSDSNWRKAVEQSVRSGNSAITQAITPIQAPGGRTTYAYLVPVYKNGTIHETAEQREQQLAGVLFAPIVIDQALGSCVDVADGLVELKVYDSDHPTLATKIFDSESRRGEVLHADGEFQDSAEMIENESVLNICDRLWTLRTTSTAKFEAGFDHQTPMITAVSGTLMSGFIAALVWSIGLGRTRAMAIATAMTAGLSEATQRAESIARELKVKSNAIAIQRERPELALSGGGVATWDWNVQTCEVQFDQRWTAIIGEQPQTQQFDQWIKRIHPDDIPSARAGLDKHFAGQTPMYESAHRLRHADMSWRWTRTKGIVVSRDGQGWPIRMVGISEDITREKNSEAAILSAAAILRRTGEIAKVGGWEMDAGSHEMTWTEQVYRIHEIEPGTPITTELALSFYTPEFRVLVEQGIRIALTEHKAWDLEVPLTTAKGNSIWVRSYGEPIIERGSVLKICGAFQDITQRKRSEEQLRLSATHDKLTGLANRALLHDRLQECLSRSERSPDRPFAVLFLDFDRFKLVNDSLGHEAGDDLLKMIASRLRASLRTSDSVALKDNYSMASRLGGDEFVVILDNINSHQDAIVVADRLLATFAEPYQLGQHKVVSTASIGIVTNKQTYNSADEMLRDADTAMYEAKAAGKGRYVVFDVAMHERVENLVKMEKDLRSALEADQFFLMYQPIVSLQNGKVVGVEALVRWNHPERGLVVPSAFIPIAEETGLILQIGQWVLREACTQFMAWQKELGDAAPPSISVNLSRTQLVMANLPQMITDTLAQCGMDPACLHLEVTETAVMMDAAASTRMLSAIKQIGVKLDMDDFGTGHSSLASLHQFPIDVLKIDQSFIRNIDRGRDFSALVQAILQLARNLEIQVVAEGIETTDQVAFLGSLDCAFGQGYLFSKPLMPDRIGAFIAQPLLFRTSANENGNNAELAA